MLRSFGSGGFPTQERQTKKGNIPKLSTYKLAISREIRSVSSFAMAKPLPNKWNCVFPKRNFRIRSLFLLFLVFSDHFLSPLLLPFMPHFIFSSSVVTTEVPLPSLFSESSLLSKSKTLDKMSPNLSKLVHGIQSESSKHRQNKKTNPHP